MKNKRDRQAASYEPKITLPFAGREVLNARHEFRLLIVLSVP